MNEENSIVKSESIDTEKSEIVQPDLYLILMSFTNNLNSLKSFVDTFSPLVLKEIETRSEHVKEEIDKIFIESGIDLETLKTEENESRIALSKKDLIKIIELSKTLEVKHISILMGSSFVLLISYFEFLFSDLLSFFYTKHYGQFKDTRLAISDLDLFANLEEAKNFYISKEVENLLLELKTFDQIKNHYQDKLNVPLDEKIIDWKMISDARERRHLIVHNNGIVNRKFLNSVDIDKALDKSSLEIGKEVKINKKYFEQIFNEIYSAGIFMIFNCWGKHQKSKMDEAFSLLLDHSYNSLKMKNYEIVEKLGKYLIEHSIEARNENQEDLLLRIKFNCCIALKKLDKKPELNNKLSDIKIATLSPIFKIAHYALQDDKEKVLTLISSAKLTDNFDYSDIEEWVLFDELREDSDFMEKAKNLLS